MICPPASETAKELHVFGDFGLNKLVGGPAKTETENFSLNEFNLFTDFSELSKLVWKFMESANGLSRPVDALIVWSWKIIIAFGLALGFETVFIALLSSIVHTGTLGQIYMIF